MTMADFEDDFKAHLQADAALLALVGPKIFPLVIPQGGNVPAITYTVVDGEPRNSLDGWTSNLTNYHVQVDCWAASYETAKVMARLVRNRANLVANNFRSVIIRFPAEIHFEDGTKRYRRMIELSCWHNE
jgi:hypothetical protein